MPPPTKLGAWPCLKIHEVVLSASPAATNIQLTYMSGIARATKAYGLMLRLPSSPALARLAS